jgi:hypothetical protein
MDKSVLGELVSASPRSFLKKDAAGERLLSSLLLQCRQAGLTAASVADDDVQRLFALFDVALENGLGCVVQDYVVEVCGRTLQVSTHGTEDCKGSQADLALAVSPAGLLRQVLHKQ